MSCECVSCASCGGSGHYYVDMITGKYQGQHRTDDLDEMEDCEDCRGSGVSETCYECSEAMELEL